MIQSPSNWFFNLEYTVPSFPVVDFCKCSNFLLGWSIIFSCIMQPSIVRVKVNRQTFKITMTIRYMRWSDFPESVQVGNVAPRSSDDIFVCVFLLVRFISLTFLVGESKRRVFFFLLFVSSVYINKSFIK